MKNSILLLFVASMCAFTGCSNMGTYIATNSTTVELSEGNYNIIATNISGEAEVSYLIGVSTSWGVTTNATGLIKLDGSDLLYKDAKERLWKNFEAEYSEVEGRKLALVNVQYDADTKNFIVFTKAKITITADVIEFY